MAKDGQKRRHLEDDVLTGFERTGERQVEFRGFFTALLAVSLYAWEITFDLGAYHTLFFYREDRYLAVSMALLVGVLVVRKQVRETLWLAVAIAPPAALFLFRVATPVKHPEGIVGVIGDVLIVANIVGLPLTAWVIGRMLAPEYFHVRGRRLRIALAATVAGASLAGFLAGQYNYRYLTCEDFVVAGFDTPPNCHHEPPD
jgi:hypothetical protein